MGYSTKGGLNLNHALITDMFEDYPDCITTLQLQQMLSIGRNKAYELLTTGQIKHKRIGKTYIIPKVYVIEYLLDIA